MEGVLMFDVVGLKESWQNETSIWDSREADGRKDDTAGVALIAGRRLNTSAMCEQSAQPLQLSGCKAQRQFGVLGGV